MRIVLNSLMLLIVIGGSAANIYWQMINPWVCGIAVVALGYFACIAVEKAFSRRAYRQMREEHGDDWSSWPPKR